MIRKYYKKCVSGLILAHVVLFSDTADSAMMCPDEVTVKIESSTGSGLPVMWTGKPSSGSGCTKNYEPRLIFYPTQTGNDYPKVIVWRHEYMDGWAETGSISVVQHKKEENKNSLAQDSFTLRLDKTSGMQQALGGRCNDGSCSYPVEVRGLLRNLRSETRTQNSEITETVRTTLTYTDNPELSPVIITTTTKYVPTIISLSLSWEKTALMCNVMVGETCNLTNNLRMRSVGADGTGYLSLTTAGDYDVTIKADFGDGVKEITEAKEVPVTQSQKSIPLYFTVAGHEGTGIVSINATLTVP